MQDVGNVPVDGKKIRSLRKAKFRSQGKLLDRIAKLGGTLSLHELSNIENGRSPTMRRMNFDFLRRALDVFSFQIERASDGSERSIVEESEREYSEPVLSPIELYCENQLYKAEKVRAHVSAVRLWGAGDHFVTEQHFDATYVHQPFKVHSDLKKARDEWIVRRKKETEASGQLFFNGPNLRLMSFRDTVSTISGTPREQPRIEVRLGPVEWFDFAGLNGRMRGILDKPADFEKYLKLSEILKSRNVSDNSMLTNIVDCNVTIITTDGYAAYQLRSTYNESVPYTLSSSVSENVNRYKDDVTKQGKAGFQLVNPDYESEKEVKEGYKPRGVPHPFWTARRGIGEELSTSLLDYLQPNALKLTGICYNLEGYHPDFLFVAAIDLTKKEVEEKCQRNPGKGFREVGELRFTRACIDDETERLLAQPGWVAGDEASLFRALEVIESLKKQGDYPNVFRLLRDRSSGG